MQRLVYTSCQLRSRAVLALAAIAVVLAVVGIVSTLLQQADLPGAPVDGCPAHPPGEVRQSVIAQAQIVVGLILLAAFLLWIYQAHANLPALGAKYLKYSPPWAVGWFFIPIFNLFRPVQVIEEIWKASDPDVIDKDGLAWVGTPMSALVVVWWILFLVGMVWWRIALHYAAEATTSSALCNADFLSIIDDGLTAVSAAMTMALVWMTTRRQEEKYARLQELRSTWSGH